MKRADTLGQQIGMGIQARDAGSTLGEEGFPPWQPVPVKVPIMLNPQKVLSGIDPARMVLHVAHAERRGRDVRAAVGAAAGSPERLQPHGAPAQAVAAGS